MGLLHERLMRAGLNPSAIREVAERHGATHVRIFGSIARGDSHGDSGLGLLVELKPGRGLLDVVAIKQICKNFSDGVSTWSRNAPLARI